MKKFIISTCCLFVLLSCSSSVFAQYTFFTGGTLKVQSVTQSGSDSKELGYTISPYIGASVSDNILVGLALGYQSQKDELNSTNYIQSNIFSITPFARYRVTPSDKMGLYGELGASIKSGTVKTIATGSETENKTSGFRVYVGPGFDYAFADRWVVNALWGALSYETSKAKDADNGINGLTFNLDPANISLSLNFLF